jgi:hypothetical protein
MRRVYGVKVTRLTLGDLLACHELVALQGGTMSGQKSAEAIRAAYTEWQRAEHMETSRRDAFDG